MKLNLSCLVSIFSLCTGVLALQANAVEFYFSDSQSVRTTENNLQYRMSPLRSSLLQISGFTQTEERMNFNQKIRGSVLELAFSLERNRFQHIFQSGYEYHYDANELIPEYQPYQNKTAYLGYALTFDPVDSLRLEAGVKGYLRTEEDRYVLSNTLHSQGYQITCRAQYGREILAIQTGLGLDLDRKRLDWEYYQTAALSAYLNRASEGFAFNNQLSISTRQDSLYMLGQSALDSGRGFYSVYDRQKRNSLAYSGILEYSSGDALQVTAQEFYTQRITGFDTNIVRNNADYLNQATLKINALPWRTISWQNTLQHSYDIKDFNYTRNTRHTETRGLGSVLAWEYTQGDSLLAGFGVDLQRTSFPDDENNWDNDLRNIRLRLGNVHYWHQRIKVSNRLNWNVTDDIYVKSLLSSNNKQTSSLTYNPECAILVGDRVLFNQTYLIRADYTRYVYDAEKRGLYRQLNLKYNLVFDSFPFIARSSDLRWMLLPYRTKGDNAFLTDFSFAFEQNEYADYNLDTEHYLINFKNQRYTAALTLKHDIRDIYYIIQPKYSWGTWTEYNLLLGLAWKFNNDSLLEFSLNPLGETLDSLDWRTSVNLNLQF